MGVVLLLLLLLLLLLFGVMALLLLLAGGVEGVPGLLISLPLTVIGGLGSPAPTAGFVSSPLQSVICGCWYA